MPTLGPMQLLIVAGVIILLFGTKKLAGLGKSAGRSLREFKEETRGLTDGESDEPAAADQASASDREES